MDTEPMTAAEATALATKQLRERLRGIHMTDTERLFHDYEHTDPETREAMLHDFLLRTESQSSLPVGVWFHNADFYRYRGKLPIVVESESHMRPQQFVVLSGCTSCQLAKVAGKVKRWLILPP